MLISIRPTGKLNSATSLSTGQSATYGATDTPLGHRDLVMVGPIQVQVSNPASCTWARTIPWRSSLSRNVEVRIMSVVSEPVYEYLRV
ncbi:hypothetical protein SCLCIDRAFT_1220395 [Scleroderma citrinum Foug A]|uniref:Uncharacterized protein n=1 Tax=Scleroderma citrinum Foug A TaxID=1036808 RepID=A0A0C3DJV1_9AGAM|nr:hypothetical protein SCLCIDRAFT_1220395 [Scleroderma citrinum Foug A]